MDYGRGYQGNPGSFVPPPGQVPTQPESQAEVLNIDDRFLGYFFKFRKRFISLWGARVDIFDDLKQPQFHIYRKALRLREDIRIYGDPGHTEELLHIQAREIIDFSAAYDVLDMQSGNYVGTLRRKGWSSLAQDSWEILDLNQNPVATIKEDNLGLALVRRFVVGSLLPASYQFESMIGENLATIRTHFNLIFTIMDLRIPNQAGPRRIDPRMVIAGTALIQLLEGKQQTY